MNCCRLAIWLVTLALFVAAPLNAADRPNVVVILADDQGWGDLSVNGNTNLNTPHIDSLAKDGATFDRFYVCSVCSPTRAEFLTGRYHPRSGVFATSKGGERMDLDESTIADTFKAAGYDTGAFGKWHNGAQFPYHPNARGFDEFYGFLSGHLGDYYTPTLDHNGEMVRGDKYVSDDYTDKAINFIERVVRGSPDPVPGGSVRRPDTTPRPFFAYLAFNSPHSPMQVPDRWWNAAKTRDITLHGTQARQENIEHTRAAMAMCENIDWNVGRILTRLNELGIADNTIVVYFCDNGPNGHRWNGGMKGVKGSVDEGGVRSPLLMCWPTQIAAGKRVSQVAAAIDLLPTLTELAQVPIVGKKQLDGLSLKSLLISPPNDSSGAADVPAEIRNRIIINHWTDRTSARSKRFRLDENGKLFDVIDDPGQTKNLNQRYPQVKARLAEAANAWRDEMHNDLARVERPISVGHPSGKHTLLPAADGIGHGNVHWSSPHPNSSFFTGWKSTDDRITWNVDVAQAGDYQVDLFYTCPVADVGSTIELSFNDSHLNDKISEPNDPQTRGAEHDRLPRGESYVKDFRAMELGKIHLEKGRGELTLRALDVPGAQAADVQMLRLTRVWN